jgi:hypothetical protein
MLLRQVIRRSDCSIHARPALVMTSDVGGFSSRNMQRSVGVMPRRRLEKVVNKVADDTSNLRLKALPVGLWGLSSFDLGEVVMDRLKHSLEDLEAPTCPTCGIEMQWHRSELVRFVPVTNLHLVSPDKLTVAGFRFFALAA